MNTYRIALANIRFPATREESVTLAEEAIAQASLEQADVIGIGRLALSYPDLPADVLAGRPLDRLRLCRTFSDCTTAPRNGLPSGCYPLDPFYKSRPEAAALSQAKARAVGSGAGGSH